MVHYKRAYVPLQLRSRSRFHFQVYLLLLPSKVTDIYDKLFIHFLYSYVTIACNPKHYDFDFPASGTLYGITIYEYFYVWFLLFQAVL